MPPEAVGVRFDPIGHRYWTGARELLAVTTVLRDAGLVDAAWYTDAARERGAALHALTEAIDRLSASNTVVLKRPRASCTATGCPAASNTEVVR